LALFPSQEASNNNDWLLQYGVIGSIFINVSKQAKKTHVVHKKLHVFGSLILALIVLKHPLL
jgi:hypothetical protein